MNVNYFFVFIISPVLQNVLSSPEKNNNTMSEEEIKYREKLGKYWTSMTPLYAPIMKDTRGNVLLRVVLNHSAKHKGLFVPSLYRIGIHVLSKGWNDRSNNEMINYLADIFHISSNFLSISAGFTSSLKSIRVTHGHITYENIIKEILKNLGGKKLQIPEK